MPRLSRRPGPGTSPTDTTLIRVLARNAEALPERVAMREKDKGIWQETTWRAAARQRACLRGRARSLGFGAGEVMLVLGDNRPRLYTGMLAAGALARLCDAGLSRTRRPTRSATSCTRRARASCSPKTRSRSTRSSICASSGAAIEHIIYDDPRGLAAYPDPGLISWDALQARGARAPRREAGLRDALIARAQPEGPGRLRAFVGHAPASRRASCCRHRNVLAGVRNAYRARRFPSSARTILAYLPMAWVGDFAMTIGAGIALHFTINIPERQETVLHNLREIAPTFYLAAPRSWDNLLTAIQVRMEDSTRLKKAIYEFFMSVGAVGRSARKLEGGEPTLGRAAAAPARRVAGLRADQGSVRSDAAARRLHRRRGDGRGYVRVLPRARHQAAPALRPDRKQRLQRDPGASDEVRLHTVGRPLPGVEVQISRSRRNPGPLRQRVRAATSSRTKPPAKRSTRRLAAHRRRRLSRARRPSGRAGAAVGGGAHREGRALHPELHREPAQVQPVRQGCRRARHAAATRWRRSSASTRSRSATGRSCAASRTCPTPTCRSGPRCIELVARRRAGTSTRRCRRACSCAASLACTRSSMPTTARSRAPASSAATSSRSATRRSSTRSTAAARRVR